MDYIHNDNDKVQTSLSSFRQWIAKAGLDTKDYQEQGVYKMLSLELDDDPYLGCRGGFLTDEMGLGKTIQMLGLIISNFQQRTLIVVPRALIDQWETAVIKFFGHHPLVYHGSRKNHKELHSSPVVITTYGTIGLRVTKSGKKIVSPLTQLSWGRVIYDEAHHMRNSSTGAFKGAEKINAHIKWFVTGTPIQNAQKDVYSLIKLFGISRDIYNNPSGLRQIANHFRIGRTKKQVGIDLKPVILHNIEVQWETDAELNLAADMHSILSFSSVTATNVDALISALTDHTFVALLRMRQSCIHMGMIASAASKLIDSGILHQEDVRDGIQGSSKLNAVISTIQERRHAGNKIIFSFFHYEIDYIARILTDDGFRVAIVDGRTTQKERENRLTASYDILILQIQSSCEGLNLQSYNEIYFTSPPWNPAVQDQAIARAHRIGQQKQVHVFQFKMAGFGYQSLTIDDYCLQIQNVKRELSKSF